MGTVSSNAEILHKFGIPEKLKTPKVIEKPPVMEEEIDEDFVKESEAFNVTLHPLALHGLAGEVVKMIEPHSESDTAALLINFLVAMGNVVGNEPHFVAQANEHKVRLFAALVGESSKGRKGSSWGPVKTLLKAIDAEWIDQKVQSGLSSGEGLINAVRDKVEKMEPKYDGKGKDRTIVGYENVIVDEGVEDKRLLCMEEEFATVLRVLSREGNTLSALIRQAWDDGNIRTLTKNPMQATGAHISILAHVTKDELVRYLGGTEMSNGFANRFLWVFVKRSKKLPDGGEFHKMNLAPMVNKIREVVDFARNVGRMERDEQAKQIWHAVYDQLSEGLPGLVGSATSRGEAQVMRLACLYALLDQSKVIKAEHLQAALALWEYSFKSAQFIFGTKLGDPVTDKIMDALKGKQEGMTKTEISRDIFSKNIKKEELNAAVNMLIKNGYVRVLTESKGKGRPTQRIVLN